MWFDPNLLLRPRNKLWRIMENSHSGDPREIQLLKQLLRNFTLTRWFFRSAPLPRIIILWKFRTKKIQCPNHPIRTLCSSLSQTQFWGDAPIVHRLVTAYDGNDLSTAHEFSWFHNLDASSYQMMVGISIRIPLVQAEDQATTFHDNSEHP